MRQPENNAATHLQADDLRLILDRLEDIPEVLCSGRVKQAKEDLGIARGFARASQIAAESAAQAAKFSGDRTHFQEVGEYCESIVRLVSRALQKFDQGRASMAMPQIDGAISVARWMIEAAEKYAEVTA